MTPALLVALLTALAPADSLAGRGGGWRRQMVVVPAEGSIALSDAWLIEGTAEFLRNGVRMPPATPPLWNDSLSCYIIAAPSMAAGDSLLVIWRSAAVTDRSTFFYYQPYHYPLDTSRPSSHPPPPLPLAGGSKGGWSSPGGPLAPWRGLRRSGSITRGVRFGTGSETGGTSGLHLELSGRPAPGVELEAMVDDRALRGGSQGGSATLAELDRLLIKVATPHLQGVLGDWDLDWESGRYGTLQRRLKGGEISVAGRRLAGDAAAAGGENRFATTNITARGGDQGPYELTDRYGGSGVTVAAGSERVWLDGRRLRRGLDADYTMDYGLGQVTFNPTIPILDGARIEVEYEYGDDAYPKGFYAARGAAAGGASGLRLELLAAQEGRDGARPLAFEWTPESRRAAEEAGDDPRGALVSAVDSVGPGAGDYRDSARVLIFSPPDSLGRPTGYLRAEFSADSSGGYERLYDPSLQQFYYYWVGAGQGTFSPLRRLPLPDRARLAQARGQWGVRGFSGSVEAAASDYDRNILSDSGDGDNIGRAFVWRGSWSPPDSLLLIDTQVRREEAAFHPLARPQEVDYRYRWDITGTLPERPESALEGGAELRPSPGLRLRGEAGRLERGGSFRGDRGGLGLRFDGDKAGGELTVEGIATEDASRNIDGLRERLLGGVESRVGRIRPHLNMRAERQRLETKNALTGGEAFYQGEPGVRLLWGAAQELDFGWLYRHDERPVGGRFSPFSDSRAGRIGLRGRTPLATWTASFLRSLQTFADPAQKSIRSTSAAVGGDAGAAGSSVRVRADYRLTTGNRRAEAWVASYVGSGRGGYRREGDRYVPDPEGAFDLRSIQTDLRFASRVEFDGRLDWRPRSRGDSAAARFPFGVSGTTTRFEAAATTAEPDPQRAFLLDRAAFRSPWVASSRWNWRQDINFLEGVKAGDGRLTLRRDESRDASLAGGEEMLLESATFRARLRGGDRVNVIVEPLWEKQRRWGLVGRPLRSAVTSSGSDLEVQWSTFNSKVELALRGGSERRREAVQGIVVNETRVQPKFRRRFGDDGSARLEGEWRRLVASSTRAGYDLLRGWSAGDNYGVSLSLDYRLGKSLAATASFQSRWRAGRPPMHSGLIEMTASL